MYNCLVINFFVCLVFYTWLPPLLAVGLIRLQGNFAESGKLRGVQKTSTKYFK